MPNPLVECIPNFSDARRPDVIEAIASAISAVPGVRVLDRHSDMDHNRSVITFVGPPPAVEEAAFQAIQTAARLIDLDHHHGEHPRIGATDVVPFVPISDVSMVECVEIARRLGKRVGEELQIPVYLYEEAATRPERQNLENIRRGQYEALKEEMGTKPERDPDYGPARVGPAGATVIGARQPLVAYNVFLTTGEVSIAQKIARAVRSSSGGLRYVKALGLLVDGRAQVSMNLTNFHLSPLARVVEFVRREAARYGVGVHHSELVGLIPQDALVDAAQWYLQMDGFHPTQLLENRLFEASATTAASSPTAHPTGFLDDLAAGTATPGGGSAAAHTAAAAAALVAMVCRLTIGKKKYAAVEPRMWAMIEQAETLRSQLTQAVSEDAAAYEAVMAALRLPKETDAQHRARTQAIEQATLRASDVPLQVARKAAQVLDLAVEAAGTANVNAISDAASGAALAQAALTGAGLNVRINVPNLQDRSAADRLLADLSTLENQAAERQAALRRILTERGGLPAV
jgi:glutamate formiminotransferase / formiminotetrahydrofolate cyclodeaminase